MKNSNPARYVPDEDFTNVPQGNYVLGNVGPDEPFGGSIPNVDFDAADPNSTDIVLDNLRRHPENEIWGANQNDEAR